MIIAVCDDEVHYRDSIALFAQQWKRHHPELSLIVKSYETAEALYEDWISGICFDILFLDIKLKYMSGLDLALEIRKTDPHMPIVFISSYERYAISGYEASAFRFLMKPLRQSAVDICLDHALACRANQDQFDFYITKDGANVRIFQRDILSIACSRHQAIITIHQKSEPYTFRMTGSFDDLASMLKAPFLIRCHGSYIINAMYVQSFSRTEVLMTNGQVIPISRTYLKDTMHQLHSYSSGGIL